MVDSTSSSPNKQLTNKNILSDPKFLKFNYLVERTLSAFDSVNEWADVSAFLSRLLKCFESYPQFKIIPHKYILAKRLAQCLNPALPTGVHQKALSVYSYIFEQMGPELLAQDLAIYAYGLFPFMQNASMSIKPQLLTIYEKYILTLDKALRPCTKSLIIGLLPGLEEEGNEYFDKVVHLLDLLCSNVSQSHFFQALWLALISAPKIRIAAINLLIRRFPAITPDSDILELLGYDLGLMVHSICAVLNDKDQLVKRGILDIVTKFLPAHLGILSESHLTQLMSYILSIFLSRDMSLNRRVYLWLSGSGESTEVNINYFKEKCIRPMNEALKTMLLAKHNSISELQKPYRILISLMDRQELGPTMLQFHFPNIIEAMYLQHQQNPEHVQGLIITTRLFLDTIEPYFVWSYINKLLDNLNITSEESYKHLELIKFVINVAGFDEEEVEFTHIPCFLIRTLNLIQSCDISDRVEQNEINVLQALELCTITMSKLPKNIFDPDYDPIDSEGQEDGNIKAFEITTLISKYYNSSNNEMNQEDTNTSQLLFGKIKGQNLFNIILYKLLSLSIIVLKNFAQSEKISTCISTRLFTITSGLLKQLTSFQFDLGTFQDFKTAAEESNDVVDGSALIEAWTKTLILCCHKANNFDIIEGSISSLVDLTLKNVTSTEGLLTRAALKAILDKLWKYLNFGKEGRQIRAIEIIWALGSLFPMSLIEDYFSKRIANFSSLKNYDDMTCFGLFWKISIENGHDPAKVFNQPLLIVLDSLSDEQAEIRQLSQSWVRTYISTYHEIFNVMLESLTDKEFRRISSNNVNYTTLCDSNSHPNESKLSFKFTQYETMPDLLQVDYIINTLINLSKSEGKPFIDIILNTTISDGQFVVSNGLVPPETSYFIHFIQILICYLISDFSANIHSDKQKQNNRLFCSIGQLLHIWIPYARKKFESENFNEELFCELLEIISLRLESWISHENLSTQVEFLPVFLCLINSSKTKYKKLDFDRFQAKMEFCLIHRYYPLNVGYEEVSTTSNYPMSIGTFYLKSLLILVLKEPKAKRVIREWFEIFLLAMPRFNISALLKSVVEPVLDCAQMQIHLTEHESVDTTIEFLSQCYSNLCSCLGVKKWANLSNTAKKSHSVFDRLSSILDNKKLEHTFDKDLLIILSDRLPLLIVDLTEAFILSRYNKSSEFTQNNKTNNLESDNNTINYLSNRIQNEIIKCVETLSTLFHKDFFSAFAEAWYSFDQPINKKEVHLSKSYKQRELLKILIKSTSFSLSSFFFEWLQLARKKVQEASMYKANKTKEITVRNCSDLAMLQFLDSFLLNLPPNSGSSLASMWSIFISFYKDVLYSINSHKYLLYPLLSLFERFCNHAGSPNDIQDKRLKRDVQDTFQKLLDNVIIFTSKAYEQTSWLGLTSSGSDDNLAIFEGVSHLNNEDSFDKELLEKIKTDKVPNEAISLYKALSFIDLSIIPHLQLYLSDHDKICSSLGNLMYYFITPYLKNNNFCYPISLSILNKMTKWDFCYKCWKREVWDAFLDSNFFDQEFKHIKYWTTLVNNIVKNEKEKIPEILSRISATPSNLFSSRDQEIQNSALMLRKLSFIIFCGELDMHLISLPIIQEKLVELIKSSSPDLVTSEIFLCLRVMLCRFSTHLLNSFWPVLLTELMQILQNINIRSAQSQSKSAVSLSTEDEHKANLVLSVCKFLDTLFTLQTEEFQMFQWIFINETLDFISAGRQVNSSLIDKLGNSPLTKPIQDTSELNYFDGTRKKKPMITLKKIKNINELESFFNQASSWTFTNTYNLLLPDIESVEMAIMGDFIIYNHTTLHNNDN